ncbi:DUF5686 and carboxypeptidase regulatory-like domain-containing protein [Mucilaginibacter ginkgonis]|uniref:Carboxypeptidase-like regulatory domain-containing protein n=1 Tax=Mucilaginibacter ginkgonis TaxID=2682091 RepID=A0A6I4INQ3_9SPHI|nr:DUF5686 and carboxypeptidase regulatory-like domain-containing protein [Mucilaginibacter ginkgonis]QQL48672.1 carboxypeptidase-like regulatory domain-containing protein [Mucilaginibacter ginkgonis]
MYKRIIFSAALLLWVFTASAQQFTLSGNIVDDTGAPVPFASILVKGTTRGTSANNDGNYSLNLAKGQYEILFKAIGYKEELKRVNISGNTKLDVRLAVAAYQLNAVTIRPGGEDPSYAIIRKAIRKRNGYLNEVNAYSAEVYLKGLQKLLAAPKKFLGRDINQIAREYGLDSNRRGIVYLSESQSKLTFEKPDKIHEEMISSKVSGSNRAFSFNRASDIRVNMYENYQNWEQISNRPLVSPIADNALSYYNYKWLGTSEENGETINKIQVTPKHSYDPAFAGIIYIMEDSWRLHSFDLEITKSANLNIVDTLKVKEQYVPVGKKVWMPSTAKMEFNGGIFGFKFGGYFIAVYSNYNLNPTLNQKEFAEVLKIPQGVNKKDSVYWQQERPVPLTTEEITDYQKKAILAKKRESKPYLDSLDRIGNRVTANKLLLTGILERDRYKKQYTYFSPLLTSFLYNTVEGFTFNYNVNYVKQIDSINNKYLRLGGNVRYGIRNERFHGFVDGTVPLSGSTLSFAVGNSMFDINNTNPTSPLFNTFNSLFRRLNQLKLYERSFVTVSLNKRIYGGLRGGITIDYSDRQWLPNTSLYSITNLQNYEFTSNNPLTPKADNPLFPRNQSFTVNLHASYNFSNRYETYPTGRRYLPSPYPTLTVNYTRAIRNVFGSDVDYNFVKATLSKEDISLGPIGKSSFYIGAGKFFGVKQIYFTDYAHFYGNEGVFFVNAPNAFLILPLYEFSTPESYLEAHYEHNFGGYFLSRVPLIRKLKLHEIVNVNYLATPQIGNYVEFAAGVQLYGIRFQMGRSFRTDGHSTSTALIGLALPMRPARPN